MPDSLEHGLRATLRAYGDAAPLVASSRDLAGAARRRAHARRAARGGVLALAVAAVVGLSAMPGPSHGPAPSGGTGPATAPAVALDGGAILLVASTRAAVAAPQRKGAYWYTKVRQFTDPSQLPERRPNDGRPTGRSPLPDAPVTVEAWVGADGRARTITTDSTGAHTSDARFGSQLRFTIGEASLTWKQVQALPAEPRPLARRLSQFAGGRGLVGRYEAIRDLLEAPAPPRVKAAAYRLLSLTEEVRGLGEVTDPAGRTGQGVELPGQDGMSYQLIVDPDGRLLAWKALRSGKVVTFVATLASGFRDRVGQR